jgi:hypothetical protein
MVEVAPPALTMFLSPCCSDKLSFGLKDVDGSGKTQLTMALSFTLHLPITPLLNSLLEAQGKCAAETSCTSETPKPPQQSDAAELDNTDMHIGETALDVTQNHDASQLSQADVDADEHHVEFAHMMDAEEDAPTHDQNDKSPSSQVVPDDRNIRVGEAGDIVWSRAECQKATLRTALTAFATPLHLAALQSQESKSRGSAFKEWLKISPFVWPEDDKVQAHAENFTQSADMTVVGADASEEHEFPEWTGTRVRDARSSSDRATSPETEYDTKVPGEKEKPSVTGIVEKLRGLGNVGREATVAWKAYRPKQCSDQSAELSSSLSSRTERRSRFQTPSKLSKYHEHDGHAFPRRLALPVSTNSKTANNR